MKFNIKYSKLGNKFFFISNLTEWHFSCRPTYNEVWMKNIEKLTDKEKGCLDEFKKILQKYSFEKYLGLYFIVPTRESSVWHKLKDNISNKEFKTIKETFDIFELKFKQVWKSNTLQKNAKVLQEGINKNSIKIFNDLEKLFGKTKKKNFNIYLIAHPRENWVISGGANIKNNGITLECNQINVTDKDTLNNTLAVIYHELLHMLYGKRIRMTADIFYKNEKSALIPYRDAKNLTEEIVMHSMFPNIGYLSNKYFYKKSQKVLLKKFNDYKINFYNLKKKKAKVSRNEESLLYNFMTLKMYPLIKTYLDKNKQIDKKFISEVIKILEN